MKKVQFKSNYENGLRNGDYLIYRKNGNLFLKTPYKNGIIDGEYVVYFNNGKIKIKRVYKNGVLVERVRYKKNGKLKPYSFEKRFSVEN